MNNSLSKILTTYEVSRDTLVAVEITDDAENSRIIYHFSNEYTATVFIKNNLFYIVVGEEWDTQKKDSKIIVSSIDRCFIALDAVSRLAPIDIERNKKDQRLEKRVKREAITRLYDLGILEGLIREFNRNNNVFVSSNKPVCEPVDNYPGLSEIITQIEKQNNVFVYHVVKNGNSFFLLYVSRNIKKWGLEISTFPLDCEAYVAAYQLDINVPLHSHDTTIAVKDENGRLVCLSC